MDRLYSYVGPRDLLEAAQSGRRQHDLTLEALTAAEDFLAPEGGFATFVVTETGRLRIAPRRSEHVTLAQGRPVLSAGEIRLVHGHDTWQIVEITNQSTGYCPNTSSWPAVARALDALAVAHPASWTAEFVFSTCSNCHEVNVITDGSMICRTCSADLDTQQSDPPPSMDDHA